MGTPTTTVITPTRAAAAPSDERLAALCVREHSQCFACRAQEKGGLGVVFHVQPDGAVATEWKAPKGYESYVGILHGGLIATTLDSAMVHALFARDIVARTGELDIRYRRSVLVAERVAIRAWLTDARAPLYRLEAEMWQQGRLCAHARAKFMAT